MKSIKIVVLLFLLVIGGARAGGEQRLTLEEAIDLAVAASEEIRISREELHRAVLNMKEAGARRLPALDFSGQYLYTSEVMKLIQPPTSVNLGIASVTIPGREMAFGDEHTIDFRLRVTQPLFTGFGLTKARRVAYKDAWESKLQWDRVKLDIRYRAEEVYIQTQKAAAVVEANRVQVETLHRHLEDARRRVEEGVAPAEVAARAELAWQQARMQLQEAERGSQLAQFALCELLDLPENGEELQLDSLILQSLDAGTWTIERALTHRLELDELGYRQEAVAERIGVQQAAYYPSLWAFGALNYGRPGVDRLANEWMFCQTAGLTLSWTLWDWNLRHYQVQHVRSAGRQLDETRKALESRIRQEVRATKLALEDALRRLEVARESLRLSSDILGWVSERYQQGVATEKEYLDAQDDDARSRLQLIVAIADCRLAEVALKRACGGESEE